MKHARNLLVYNTKTYNNSSSISTRFDFPPLRVSEITVVISQRSLLIVKYACALGILGVRIEIKGIPPQKIIKNKQKYIVDIIRTLTAVDSQFKHFISLHTMSDLSQH